METNKSLFEEDETFYSEHLEWLEMDLDRDGNFELYNLISNEYENKNYLTELDNLLDKHKNTVLIDYKLNKRVRKTVKKITRIYKTYFWCSPKSDDSFYFNYRDVRVRISGHYCDCLDSNRKVLNFVFNKDGFSMYFGSKSCSISKFLLPTSEIIKIISEQIILNIGY